MNIYFSEHSLAEGFEILSQERREDRLARGRQVSGPSGWKLFSSLRDQPIKCWHCGCEADRWVATKHKNDHGAPVLNLYATANDGSIVMMTRDHIIPKSLGGVDAIENLRPGCAPCNEDRSNTVSKKVIEFAKANPHLVSQERIRAGLNALHNNIGQHGKNKSKAEIDALKAPFIAMGYIDG